MSGSPTNGTITAPWIPTDAPAGKRLVLDYGIALHRGAADWCRQAAVRLGRD